MTMIGEKIKTLRKDRKFTQKELAKKIGVTASTVTKYENGQLEPNIEVLNRISNIFRISISALVEDNYSRKEFFTEPEFLSLYELVNSKEITEETIDKLTKCIIRAVINKYNLNIDINKIDDSDKKLIFNLASSSVKVFIEDLINRNN